MMRAPQDAREEQRLTSEQVEALMPYGTELKVQAGDILFDEKSVVDSFYVVLEGGIEISRLDGAEEIPLLTHGVGEFTGGLAVLTGRRSVHRARAGAPSRVLQINSETFRSVAVEVPDVADVFISGLARRMRQTQRAYRQQEKLAALGKLSAGPAHRNWTRRALLSRRTRGARCPATRSGRGRRCRPRPALAGQRRG